MWCWCISVTGQVDGRLVERCFAKKFPCNWEISALQPFSRYRIKCLCGIGVDACRPICHRVCYAKSQYLMRRSSTAHLVRYFKVIKEFIIMSKVRTSPSIQAIFDTFAIQPDALMACSASGWHQANDACGHVTSVNPTTGEALARVLTVDQHIHAQVMADAQRLFRHGRMYPRKEVSVRQLEKLCVMPNLLGTLVSRKWANHCRRFGRSARDD